MKKFQIKSNYIESEKKKDCQLISLYAAAAAEQYNKRKNEERKKRIKELLYNFFQRYIIYKIEKVNQGSRIK